MTAPNITFAAWNIFFFLPCLINFFNQGSVFLLILTVTGESSSVLTNNLSLMVPTSQMCDITTNLEPIKGQ